MDLDPLSIITPARIKVLLLPVGHVRQSKFAGFVQRLQQVNVVRLGDVSPDSRPHRTMFSPLAFPEGLVLYDLSISSPSTSHSALAPFELYREPLVVVGLADGVDSGLTSAQSESNEEVNIGNEGKVSRVDGLRSIVRTLEDLIDEFPKALVHQILVFDHDETTMPERIYPVPAPSKSKTTTIKTVMCDLTSRLLAEMAVYAKSLQSLPSIDSPRVSSGVPASKEIVSALPPHMVPSLGTGRSSSPINDHLKADHRMSLPEKLLSGSASGTSTPSSRPTSPPNGVRTPPASLNDISRSSTVQSPPNVSGHDRANSRGRAPAGRMGVGSLGEKERTKGKGRIGVVVGAMYLLAGRWPDAVKELIQSSTIARNSSDYLWHAKAMDLVLICLLMYAWAGMDFRIPENFFPGTEKPGSSSSKSTKHTTSHSLPDLNVSKSADPADRAASLRTLTSLLPDLTHNILNLYSRAWTFTDDKLPALAFSHSTVRFAKLLAAIHLHRGILDDVLLSHLVLNANIPMMIPPFPETPPFMTRREIVEVLFRAYPRSLSESPMDIADHTAILAGIASVLYDLGCHRKKALVLKELMTGLLPALVQARKDGAAEMGVHPAASLASLNGNITSVPPDSAANSRGNDEHGMKNFLSLVCQAYGVLPKEPMDSIIDKGIVPPSQSQEISRTLDHAYFTKAAASLILQQASAKSIGSQELKLDILRSCINLCEALPDLGGVVRYSADLLRYGGSGIAPGVDSSDGSPDLAIEEQVRLVNNISRTLSAARHLGFDFPEAEYWDDFLVRGIEVFSVHASSSLQPHAKSELEIIDKIHVKKEANPFIYNPFLKPKTSSAPERRLVAQEEALFQVTLQNLFDFDVVVERVLLITDGVPFKCEAQSTMIGPYRTQTILLSGTPQSPGTFTIHGCTAKIRGCRERNFATFSEPWSLKQDVKGKHRGIGVGTEPASTAADVGKGKTQPVPKGPTPSMLALNVLKAQPNLILRSSSLSQSAIMLLEGETRTFTISIRNTSRTALVDLLLVSFEDSASSQRLSLLSSKELSAVELYELEISSAHKQSFKWLRVDRDQDISIEPGADEILEIQVLGKPDLSHCAVQVDYGHLGIPKEDIKDQFYTRQLLIPLTVTVNSSIQIVRNDIVALPRGFYLTKQRQQDQGAIDLDASTAPASNLSLLTTSTPHCLLLVDLRNFWSYPMTVTFEIREPSLASQPSPHTISLAPEGTERIPLPLPRLYLANPHLPIPSLNPANKRQFVISATKSSPEAERAMRETFWYREALLERLKATWREESTGRTGTIELRNLRLTPQMLSSLRLPDLDISMSVASAEPPTSPSSTETSASSIKQQASSTYVVPTTTFLNLISHLYNRSTAPIRPLLRLQPTLANQPQAVALDLSKKLLVNGVLQRALPILGPGERMSVETGFLAMSQGVYEWNASVEEVVAQGEGDIDEGKKGGGRKRAPTGEMDGLGEVGRRMWVAEEPCLVHARDEDELTAPGDDDQRGDD